MLFNNKSSFIEKNEIAEIASLF